MIAMTIETKATEPPRSMPGGNLGAGVAFFGDSPKFRVVGAPVWLEAAAPALLVREDGDGGVARYGGGGP